MGSFLVQGINITYIFIPYIYIYTRNYTYVYDLVSFDTNKHNRFKKTIIVNNKIYIMYTMSIYIHIIYHILAGLAKPLTIRGARSF